MEIAVLEATLVQRQRESIVGLPCTSRCVSSCSWFWVFLPVATFAFASRNRAGRAHTARALLQSPNLNSRQIQHTIKTRPESESRIKIPYHTAFLLLRVNLLCSSFIPRSLCRTAPAYPSTHFSCSPDSIRFDKSPVLV